jgi:hypothetical protein
LCATLYALPKKALYFAVGDEKEADIREQATASFFQAAREEFFGEFCPKAFTLDSDGVDWNWEIVMEWKKALLGFAGSAFISACFRLGSKSRHLERQAGAERFINHSLNRLLKEGDVVGK